LLGFTLLRHPSPSCPAHSSLVRGEWRRCTSGSVGGEALLRVTRGGAATALHLAANRGLINVPRLLSGRFRSLVLAAAHHYSGWNNAMVFPSGSLNHADFPIPAVVATWSTVLSVGKSYSSNVTPRAARSRTSASTSLVQKRTWVWSALFGD